MEKCYSSLVIHSEDAAFDNSHIPSPDSLVPEKEKDRQTGIVIVIEEVCSNKQKNILTHLFKAV